jgi:hypothetical protein
MSDATNDQLDRMSVEELRDLVRALLYYDVYLTEAGYERDRRRRPSKRGGLVMRGQPTNWQVPVTDTHRDLLALVTPAAASAYLTARVGAAR